MDSHTIHGPCLPKDPALTETVRWRSMADLLGTRFTALAPKPVFSLFRFYTQVFQTFACPFWFQLIPVCSFSRPDCKFWFSAFWFPFFIWSPTRWPSP